MAASVAASIISVVCTNPLDVVKTRMQTDVPREIRFYSPLHDAGVKAPCTSPAKYPTDHPAAKGPAPSLQAPTFQSGPKPLGVLKMIVKNEGIRGLWRGTSAGISHALPSISIYLTCYEQMKSWLDQRANVHAELIPPIAGGVSRFYAVIITCPLEVVRTRLMASEKSQFQGADGQRLFKNWPPHKTASFDILRQLVLENGFRSLWKGMVPMLWRDVPFSAIYWSLAEGTRKFLLALTEPAPRGGEEACACPDGGETKRRSGLGVSMLVNLCSGIAAGSVASVVTHPFDLVKTRVMAAQLGSSGPARPASTYGALRDIAAAEGPWAMWRGLGPRLVKVGPSCAIVLASFELFKRLMA